MANGELKAWGNICWQVNPYFLKTGSNILPFRSDKTVISITLIIIAKARRHKYQAVLGMANIKYIETDQGDIDAIKPLWEKLNEHIRVRSPYFKRHYETFTFDRRKAELLRKAD